MGSPIVEVWGRAVVPIRNPRGELGTGFLVARLSDDQASGKILLVTNKHVIARDPEERPRVSSITCGFNTREDSPGPRTVDVGVALAADAGPRVYQEHPDPDTDVCAVDISAVIALVPQIDAKWVQYDLFGDEARRRELDVTVGEDVVTLGYPLGLRQGDSNLPLIRQAIISTKVGGILRDRMIGPDGTPRERTLRGFLIDGGTVPGSSGSPVLLKPVIGRQVRRTIQLGAAPPVLLGIVAETRYAPIEVEGGTVPGFAGLGLAFDVETIRETVERFFA